MIEGQEGVTWPDWLALAEACESNGLHGLFTSDHYLSFHGGRNAGSFDAWTVLSALAARTERIRLGTLVSPVTFRHPSLLAKAATTVDHVSGGRAELGMGAGGTSRSTRRTASRSPRWASGSRCWPSSCASSTRPGRRRP